jgi:hypothetical protein
MATVAQNLLRTELQLLCPSGDLRKVASIRRWAAASSRHRRYDGDLIPLLQRRLQVLQVAHVLIIDVHIDEVAQSPILGEKMMPEIGIVLDQMRQGFPNCPPLDPQHITLRRIPP